VLRAGFPSTGGAGHRVDGKIVEYHDRAAIEDGALTNRGLEIVWLRDAADAFFIQIQGSARIRLPDGKYVRVNYAAHNGHRYTPVGRNLIDTGIVPREEMSMENIRMFIAEMPEEGRELMRQNRAFTFFRIVTDLPPDAEAVGAQGLPLVKDRSIAVDKKLHVYGSDKKLHVYGSLFWIEAKLQLQNTKEGETFNRLMVAQDTGSAIIGVARAVILAAVRTQAASRAVSVIPARSFCSCRTKSTRFVLRPRRTCPTRTIARRPRRRKTTTKKLRSATKSRTTNKRKPSQNHERWWRRQKTRAQQG